MTKNKIDLYIFAITLKEHILDIVKVRSKM